MFTFTRELGADDALTAAVSCDTQPQNTGVPQLSDDDERVVTVEILTPLPRGGCTVAWSLRDELDQPDHRRPIRVLRAERPGTDRDRAGRG